MDYLVGNLCLIRYKASNSKNVMSYFNKKEFSNFIRYSFQHPLDGIRDFLELGRYLLTNIYNKIKFKFLSDKHRARKITPFLQLNHLISTNSKSIELFFPYIRVNKKWDQIVLNPHENIELDLKDPEAYFKQNRWGICNYFLDGASNEAIIEVIAYINRWITNPPGFNEPAWETYSVSERVANSIIFLSIHSKKRKELIDENQYKEFLFESMRWIKDHLEYYGPTQTNNHYLNNARALIMGGTVLQEVAYINLGLSIIDTFSESLFTKSGFLRERSTHYQIVVANWVMDIDFFLKTQKENNKIKISPKWTLLVTAVFEATIFQINEFGWDVLIGDVSPDISPKAACFRFMKLYGEWSLSNNTSFCLKNNDPWFCIKHSESVVIGSSYNGTVLGKHPTHRHNDATAFVWKYLGYIILVDPGRVNYTKETAAVDQVSSAYHNLLLINGFGPIADSIIINGGYLSSRYANARVTTEQEDGKNICISHNGFARIKPEITHTRTILICSDGLEVFDRIYGKGEVHAKLHYHFDKSVKLHTDSASKEISAQVVDLRIIMTSVINDQQKAEIEISAFEQSTEYGNIVISNKAIIQSNIKLPCTIVTKFKVSLCVE